MKKIVTIVGFGKLGLLHACLSNTFYKSEVSFIIESNSFLRLILSFFLKNIIIKKKIDQNIVKKTDLFIIATPPYFTPDILNKLKFYNFQKSILIEKPGFINYQQFKENLKILKKFDHVQFGFMYRYKPTFNYAKKIIRKNYKKIEKVECYAYVDQPIKENKGWRSDPKKSGGGALIVQGIHLIDLLLYYFHNLQIKNKKIKFFKKSKIDVQTNINCFNQFIKSIKISVSTEKKKYRKLELKIKVFYQNKVLEVDDDKLIIRNKNKTQTIYNFNLYRPSYYEIGDASFSNQYESFFYKNKNSKKNILDYQKVIKFISTIYEEKN